MKINTLVFLVSTLFISAIFSKKDHCWGTNTCIALVNEVDNSPDILQLAEDCINEKKHPLAGKNTIKGKIDIPKLGRSFLQKGTNYQEKSAQSAEKKQIDQSNSPEFNLYISLHPLDFTPTLSPTSNAIITQREKTFSPNIIAVTKGSTVQFMNEDEHYHNVFSLSSRARFNIGRRPTGNTYGQKIKKAGVIKLGCDIHDEMSGVILSLDTPYFTKIQENGTYQISDLPDGKYRLQVYHPAIQKYTDEVAVVGNQTVTKNLDLSSKP